MAIHNVIGDGFRGNVDFDSQWWWSRMGRGDKRRFGCIDGTVDADRRLKSMLHFDVNNGIARRSWARNSNAEWAIKESMDVEPRLKVTMPNHTDEDTIKSALT